MTLVSPKAWRAVVPLAVLTAALAGCGGGAKSNSATDVSTATSTSGSLDELVKAAKAEGSLTIYTPVVQSEVEDWVKGFTAKYGIKVDILRQSSSQVGTTFSTQARAGRVQDDIFETSNAGQLQQFINSGWIAKYTPQAADKYSKDRTIPQYAYPLYQSTGAIAWNTQTVPAATQAALEKNPYQGLLDPALKGKIVLIDPAQGGSGMAYYANLVDNLPKQYGWSYLQKLAAQNPAVATSILTISQEVSAGTYSATIFGDDAIFGPLAAKGAPVRFSSISPMNASQFYQAIPKKAPHPAAARLFSEWSEGLAGQEALTAATGGSSAIKGWTDNRPFAKQLSWYHPPSKVWLAWQRDPKYTGQQLEQFATKWDTVFHVSS